LIYILKIPNDVARHSLIYHYGLHAAPVGECKPADVLRLVKDLAYVQIDPIKVVARAHDHILWSRKNQYRPKQLELLLARDKAVFEHFCHDACMLPMEFLPYWQAQFERRANLYSSSGWNPSVLDEKAQQQVINRIRQEGPLCSKAFKTETLKKSKAIWSKPEHKKMLDYLWFKGDLAVSKRPKFIKYYDLAERMFPADYLTQEISEPQRIQWLAMNALQRMGFGTAGDIMRFWEACSLGDIQQWCADNHSLLQEVQVDSVAGESNKAFILKELQASIAKPPKPTTRLRIINPFDPLVRDRKRLEKIFGFEYTIEMYTPKDKRQYGYYVYPLLEYDQFVGRIEVRHSSESNLLHVDNLWPESGVRFGKGRIQKLESELERMRKFCGAEAVAW